MMRWLGAVVLGLGIVLGLVPASRVAAAAAAPAPTGRIAYQGTDRKLHVVNAEVADTHFAKIVVHVPAKHIENRLAQRPRRALIGSLGTAKPAAHQRQMQHDHVESAFGRVRHAETQVESRMPGLRHDRAIERGNGGGSGVAAKQPKNHGATCCWDLAH